MIKITEHMLKELSQSASQKAFLLYSSVIRENNFSTFAESYPLYQSKLNSLPFRSIYFLKLTTREHLINGNCVLINLPTIYIQLNLSYLNS